jgi:hypothetical protein
MTRLSQTITNTQTQVTRELSFVTDDLNTLLDLNRFPWTRNNMVEFCIEAEKKNIEFHCPDIIALSPGLSMIQRGEIASKQTPEELKGFKP